MLPDGWEERLVKVENENTRWAVGWCLEVHDLAVSKLVAGRDKDLTFLAAMLKHSIVTVDVIRLRIAQTSRLQEAGKALALSRLGRLAND